MEPERFNVGDRVEYTGVYWTDGLLDNWLRPGSIGTVTDVKFYEHDPKGGNVTVLWDNVNMVYGVFHGNITHYNEPTEAKPESEMTPEAAYGKAVDELLHKYADRLHDSIERDTMAYPYSHLGIFAEFLMEFENLHKPVLHP